MIKITFFRSLINEIASFSIVSFFLFFCYLIYFSKGAKGFYNESIVFFIVSSLQLSILSIIFFLPMLFVVVLIKYLFNNKINILLNFIFLFVCFIGYGYVIFIVWFKQEIADYFQFSIPLTIAFLSIWYFLDLKSLHSMATVIEK